MPGDRSGLARISHTRGDFAVEPLVFDEARNRWVAERERWGREPVFDSLPPALRLS